MAEYIDREKLLEKLSRMIYYCKNDNKVNGLTALFQVGDAIIDCPATEIIECKDCHYCRESDTTNRFFCTYQDTEFETYPNSYCSNGTPKERGGENV
jgi:hypothetical protein